MTSSFKGMDATRAKTAPGRPILTASMKRRMARLLVDRYVKSLFIERSKSQFASIDRQLRAAESRLYRAIKHG